jgi:hypothetical protein
VHRTADPQQRPDRSAGCSIVFLGAFNPAIFQPAWFMRHGLIPDEDEGAEVEAVTQQITSFKADWLSIVVQPEKCELHATDEAPSFRVLQDLAGGIFDLLAHTPVTAFGLNRFVHFAMESEAAWNDLGLNLFTHQPWAEVLDDPRMRTLQVEDRHGEREDAAHITTVTVQPSAIVSRAVFVTTNDHYNIARDATDPIDAIAKLDEVFDGTLERAGEIIERVRAL